MTAEALRLVFPGGDLVKAKPTRAQLEQSLREWAAVAVVNAEIFHAHPNAMNLSGLRSSVRLIEQTMRELEETP